METIKTTPDLRFTLNYADGTTEKVNKGILFEEGEDGNLKVHIGTDNQVNLLIAILDGIAEMLGLDEGKKAQ